MRTLSEEVQAQAHFGAPFIAFCLQIKCLFAISISSVFISLCGRVQLSNKVVRFQSAGNATSASDRTSTKSICKDTFNSSAGLSRNFSAGAASESSGTNTL